MYKDKTKQRAVNREYQRRKRQGVTKGVTSPQGVTGMPKLEGVTEGVTSSLAGVCMAKLGEEVTPDIILKLADPFWRGRGEKICLAFDHSHHPEYKEDCWLGDTNLALACDWLACLE